MNIWHLLRIVFGGLLGAAIATVICWGALYLYGTYYLHGHGSLFDTNPSAADTFLFIWLLLTAAASIAGGYGGHLAARK
ncbi:hypothetical protein RSP795_17160 [Ralstonia solanacearum]|uniref:Transmembrane protein n=1 Tax=Ralstonia solanacearum CFBP2957 TaxID=859656 RepID=D8P6G1_RALSL|nr:hypothetical protein RSP795_17160 [Ralstonia solanacearum]CBJ54497.1 exported protein of unknown function [Ralstonia solanacearum CFBP2957]